MIIKAKIGGKQLQDDLKDPNSAISKEYKLLQELDPMNQYHKEVKTRYNLKESITS